MPDTQNLRLPDIAALKFLQNKTLRIGYSHYDIWLYEHAVAFTVAKMMQADLLNDTRQLLEQSLKNGTGFHDFKQQIMPHLMKKGWWGKQEMINPHTGQKELVQLGSVRRLRTIFHTNLQTAHASARWERIQANKEDMPYLKYIASHAENKRKSHMAFYGLILPVDDPFWQKNYPPNGYGCQCSVRQLTHKQALRERQEDLAKDRLYRKANPDKPARFSQEQYENAQQGKLDDSGVVDAIPTSIHENPITGDKTRVAQGVIPSFSYNPGDRIGTLQAVYQEKLNERYAPERADRLMDELGESLAGHLLKKIKAIVPAKISTSDRIQFEMTRLIHLPPEISSRIYSKMLEDKTVMKTLKQSMSEIIDNAKTAHPSQNTVLHIGTIPLFVLEKLPKRKPFAMPETAVISISNKQYLHAIRESHKNDGIAISEDFWRNLPEKLRQPDEGFYTTDKERMKLHFIYHIDKSNSKLVLHLDYLVKKYNHPVTGKKNPIKTNMIITGYLISDAELKSAYSEEMRLF